MPQLKSIAAVVAGYLVFALPAAGVFAVSGRDPHAAQPFGFILLTVVCGVVAAAAGGFVAAAIAGRAARLHAGAVALLIAAGAIASMIAQPGDAMWSQLSALVLMAPAAVGGGRLRALPRP